MGSRCACLCVSRQLGRAAHRLTEDAFSHCQGLHLQVLVFRKDAVTDIAEYSKRSAERLFASNEPASTRFWSQPDQDLALRQRKRFVKAIIIQVLEVGDF